MVRKHSFSSIHWSQFSSVQVGHGCHGSPVGHSQHYCSREGSRPPGTSAHRDGPSKKAAGVGLFGLVRIRPFRSDLTISEPWDEGDRFE